MSSGDHVHALNEKESEAHAALLEELLAEPRIVAAIQAYKKEDDSHDVPFLGGSNNAGDTIYFDRTFVEAIKAGKVEYEGKPYDPRRFLKLHEAVEGACIRILHCNYDTDNKDGLPGGHLIATWAEHRAVTDSGLEWSKYQASLKDWISEDEHERVKNPPPDLLTVPYRGTPQAKEVKGGKAKDGVMAKLTTEQRKRIPTDDFALPGRRYPIENASHARNALARVSQHGSSEEKSQVRAKVHAKYPGIEQSPGGYAPNAMAHPRMHALSMAAATHLQNAGHLSPAQAAAIHARSRANINQLKRAPAVTPAPFGSLSPMLNGSGGAGYPTGQA